MKIDNEKVLNIIPRTWYDLKNISTIISIFPSRFEVLSVRE